MDEPTRTIDHPTFGQLKHDITYGWVGRVTLGNWGGKTWPHEIELHLPGDDDGPDPKAVELASAVRAAGSTLGDILRRGIWDEFSGAEAQGTHWWAGDLDQVNQQLDKPLKGPDDLLRVLDPDVLFVRTDVHGDGELTAGIYFGAEFEQEHGFDVLTDGKQVLGTGYSLDAEKYERFSAITPRERERRHAESRAKIEEIFGKRNNGS